ncbi:hypothetical protein M3Y99_00674800 [Aphelenchoides fujianensis]|nr:hypothetical protein M3Y99_00674800 [Aphelenchoides fujianensis]
MRTHEQPPRIYTCCSFPSSCSSCSHRSLQPPLKIGFEGPPLRRGFRRTADLTNMIVAEKTPRRFRCAYRKRAKTSTESPVEDLPPFPSAAANDAPDLKITMHEQSKRHEKEHHHRRHHHKNRANAD